VSAQTPRSPTPTEALRYGLRLGCISFGGPAGQISILHRELVTERGWVEEDAFAQALNFCMLLPGPEALQLVIYLGWRAFGAVGGIMGGLLFLLPGALLLLALSWVYVAFGSLALVGGALAGLQAVVVALVLQALWRIGGRALKGGWHKALAAGAFAALAWLHLPFPLVIGVAAFMGLRLFRPPMPAPAAAPPWPSLSRTGAVLLLGAALWAVPWMALNFAVADELPRRLYLFFSQAALVGFGGAYAVLAFVNQELVAHLHWLRPPELLTGLALAETTPGPLVLVLQFYGFMAGHAAPGTMVPIAAALLCALLASWATFLPSFVLVIALAPYLERVTRWPRLAAALEAVTAAVVGVIGSFALSVATGVLFPGGVLHLLPVAIAAGALAILTLTRIDLPWVLAIAAGVSMVAVSL
jgi:chromate transporter